MKDNPKIAQKITVHYSFAFAAFFAAFCMIRSFIAVYLNDRGFSYTQIGIITAVHMFCTAVIQPNYSGIMNHFPGLKLKTFMSLCCIPPLLCSLLTFILPSTLPIFLLFYIIFGLFEIGLQSLMVSLGMDYVNAGIPINPGIGRGFGSVGYALANILLGTLIVKFGSNISQKLNIVLLILLFLLLITLPDARSIGKNTTAREEAAESSDDLLFFLRSNRTFSRFALATIFLFFGHSIVNTYLPNVVAQFGLGTDFAGWMTGIAAGLELIPMMFYTQLSKKISPFTLLRISSVFFLIKLLTAATARNGLGIAVSQSMQILAYALFAMSSIYFANQAVLPRNRVMAQGLLVGANEAGFMIGGLAGGILIDAASVHMLLWVGVGITAIGSVLLTTSVRQYLKQPAESH